jgi:hypothetical protein
LWSEDINSIEGNVLYAISVNHALYQIIDENSRSCLDLIFCNALGHILGHDISAPISYSDHSTTLSYLFCKLHTTRL